MKTIDSFVPDVKFLKDGKLPTPAVASGIKEGDIVLCFTDSGAPIAFFIRQSLRPGKWLCTSSTGDTKVVRISNIYRVLSALDGEAEYSQIKKLCMIR